MTGSAQRAPRPPTYRRGMARCTGEGEAPNRLDAILFESFDELRVAREAEDRRIVEFVDRLDDDRIGGTIKYRPVSSPEQFEQQMAPALALVQAPDSPPRPRPCPVDRPGRPSAGTRSVVFSAAGGKIGGLTSRKLHCLACRVQPKGFALPEPMHQNCASGVMDTP
jgi:hypothetical protein